MTEYEKKMTAQLQRVTDEFAHAFESVAALPECADSDTLTIVTTVFCHMLAKRDVDRAYDRSEYHFDLTALRAAIEVATDRSEHQRGHAATRELEQIEASRGQQLAGTGRDSQVESWPIGGFIPFVTSGDDDAP